MKIRRGAPERRVVRRSGSGIPPRRIKRCACNFRTGCPTQPSVFVCMDRTHRRPRQLAKGEQRSEHAKAIGHEKLPANRENVVLLTTVGAEGLEPPTCSL
jgi:hypothetical protein